MSNPTGEAMKWMEGNPCWLCGYPEHDGGCMEANPDLAALIDPRAALIQKLRALMTELEGLSLGYMRGHDVMMSMPAPQQATAARYSGKSEAYSYCARELSALIEGAK